MLKKRILRFSYIPKEESAKVLVSLNHFPFPIVASKKYRRVVLKLSWTMEPKSRLFCTNSQAEHIWRNSNLNLLWKQNMVSCLKILKKKNGLISIHERSNKVLRIWPAMKIHSEIFRIFLPAVSRFKQRKFYAWLRKKYDKNRSDYCYLMPKIVPIYYSTRVRDYRFYFAIRTYFLNVVYFFFFLLLSDSLCIFPWKTN